MKHALTVLLMPLVLLSCERDHGDPLVTPPDATGDTGPGPGSGPGASSPLDPDQRIECKETGKVSYFDGTGREFSRTAYGIAAWSGGTPTGEPWICYKPAPAGCTPSPTVTCEVTGSIPQTRCMQSAWSVTEMGDYYVFCGFRQESDPDGDGVFTITNDGITAVDHIAVTTRL